VDKVRRLILGSLTPHVCSDYSCGVGRRPANHTGCMELDSDVFIEATRLTPARYDGTPLAPD